MTNDFILVHFLAMNLNVLLIEGARQSILTH